MKKTTVVLTLILAIMMCMTFAGCKSKEAKAVDEAISEFCNTEITVDSGDEIDEVQRLINSLSKEDKESLDNMGDFKKAVNKFDKITDEAAVEIEKLIDGLPELGNIKMSSEDAISDVRWEYDRACSEVQDKVKNYDYLVKAEAKYEQVKKDAWRTCSTCDGEGKVDCELCGGKGSRIVDYTTPNGKTWQVSQECKATYICPECYGDGGEYVE